MDKFFHTYFAGGYVSTSEIARVLLEATTGLDLDQAELASVLRNTHPGKLAEGVEALKASDDSFDMFIVESLTREPIDEDTLSYYRFQLAQWEASIEQAAKASSWTCLDLRSLAPVSPGTDAHYCVNVLDVIAWLSSVGHSPKFGDVLAEMLSATRCRNDEGKDLPKGSAKSTRESSKLATLVALMSLFPKSKQPSAKDLEKAAAAAGFEISDDTIRNVLAEARGLAPKPLPK